MSITLSIKNVPDDIALALRTRASQNHRSLQGEVMAILEHATITNSPLTPNELLKQTRALGVRTRSESVQILRKDRSGH